MSFWTYILRCSDGKYYTGHTDDLERRFAEHQSGEVRGYTSERLPVELVWSEYFQTRAEALEAEMRIKDWSRAKKEALIAGDWERVKRAAVPPRERALRGCGSTETASRLRSTRTAGGDEGTTSEPFVSTQAEPFVSSEVETPAQISKAIS